MNIYDKIENNYYKPSWEYPTKPKKHLVLSDTGFKYKLSSLSDEEILAIPAMRKEYQEKLNAYDDEVKAYNLESRRLMEVFYWDLCSDFGVDSEKDFTKKMYDISYSRGHSGGLGDVVSVFSDLVPLWEIYNVDTNIME